MDTIEQEKRNEVKSLVLELLTNSQTEMINKIERVLNCGVIDINQYDGTLILPKIIATALLENASHDYLGVGTCFEKRIKKEVKNIRYFI